MKSLGLSKQIIILGIVPALLVGLILSAYFTYDQLSYISQTQSKYGDFIIKQVQPVIEHTLTHGNMETLDPVLHNIANNDEVNYIKITTVGNNDIITINNPQHDKNEKPSFFHSLLQNSQLLNLRSPVYHNYDFANGTSSREVIAEVEIQLNSNTAVAEKIGQIIRGSSITLGILIVLSMIILKFSQTIIAPIKSLTEGVRNISSGDLDSQIDLTSAGELGILESCINHMKDELKDSRTDLEIQLNVYTDELHQTLEELEIRNAELDITRSKAIYANNAKSEFLANMSHEIRTPLSGIIGFTELLQGTELSVQQKDYLNTIHKSSRHLLEIINDVLDLSKIESGKTEIITSEFNLLDIIEDIIDLVSTSALDKNVELLYSIESDVPIIIYSDPFRIHQIVTNLIGNAIKFTEDGYVYLQVTLGEISNTEKSIRFTVSDTGIGMSSTDKKKLFKAFTQADTSITRRFGGTGLGLVISRKLTMLMHGEMDFDSTEGEGSTFWFSIPVTPVPIEVKPSDISDKKIAFICNHHIAKKVYETTIGNWQYQVSNYSCQDLDKLTDIEAENDIAIVFLSRKDIINPGMTEIINRLNFIKPSLLIASTRSHSELRNLQQNIFDNAVFTSEKIEVLKKKIISTINKKLHDDDRDLLDDDTASMLDWSNISIMVVDDNDINLRLAEIILHKHKARVTTARSGAQAIDYASINSFDMILMDLHMPGIDGYETTQKIRQITPGKQPVIIALTANAMPQEKEKANQSGMNGILIKPVSDAILQKVVTQWILKESIKLPESDDSNRQGNDTQHDANKIFSIQLAREFTGDNEDLAYELFGMFRAELNNYRDTVVQAVKNNSLSELLEQAHKLHGASRCCGTTELKQTSSHIETLINQKINFDISKETTRLLTAIQDVIDYEIDTGN
ncbi:MAG: ATP-binding protein [Gammaproteobacteria bacterium]|nr:ATP-binding protein [Gammaproteobacteria bacterium]